MASDVSTIQSLKAVDAWIDVINSNINGGVRTAFKASRLRFTGSNTNVDRAGNATSLPLQFPEPSLVTGNTVIDFTQGAITASTETTHLAIQGEGFFLVASPDMINRDPASATFGATLINPNGRLYLTRDGEFHTDANGLLRNAAGLYLLVPVVTIVAGQPAIHYNLTVNNGASTAIRAVVNDIDNPSAPSSRAINLSLFLSGNPIDRDRSGSAWVVGNAVERTVLVPRGEQSLRYASMGSTIFDFGFQAQSAPGFNYNAAVNLQIPTGENTVLNKSLEASNASMTQSVPELSLAQKLFSALTKVLQTKQTNVDGVLNLVR